MKQWVKLFSEVIDDAKVRQMSWEERGVFLFLLAACGKLDDKDERGEPTGRMLPVDQLAWYIRCETGLLSQTVARMLELGIASLDEDGCVRLVNFKKRQVDSGQRAASAQRAAQGKPPPAKKWTAQTPRAKGGYRVISDAEWDTREVLSGLDV